MYGVHKLQFGYFMLSKQSDIRKREILNELAIKAKQHYIAALDSVFEMEYWFDLFEVVK